MHARWLNVPLPPCCFYLLPVLHDRSLRDRITRLLLLVISYRGMVLTGLRADGRAETE